ncbi:MAG: protein TolR [Gammaproteobacteria bacterium]|nr:protein TolR [Gammaproteobacteria bacterium]
MASHRKRRAVAEINVVPYIDVMLVLLIIFMITAPLLQQGVEIDLPQASANPLPPEQREPVVLTVSKTGEYFLNVGEKIDEPISEEVLVHRVAAVVKYQPKTPVLVRGDKNVDYGSVTNAMVLLQTAGVEKVGLMTDQPDNQGSAGKQ